MPRISAFLLICIFYASQTPARAQNPSQSSPQAVSLAARSIAALTGGAPISDVTLTGNVTWNGKESGSATLKALGIGESQAELVFRSGTRTEIRDSQTGTQLGKWTGPNGKFGSLAYHNCLTDAAWFFPALGSLQAGANVVLSYIGEESRNGFLVQHIRSYVPQSTELPGPTLQQLSTMDFYIDEATMLPVAVTFNAHPDNDESKNLPVEVSFSEYQSISGVQVPMRVQRRQQGSLIMDIVLSSASFNTGLALSTFAVN